MLLLTSTNLQLMQVPACFIVDHLTKIWSFCKNLYFLEWLFLLLLKWLVDSMKKHNCGFTAIHHFKRGLFYEILCSRCFVISYGVHCPLLHCSTYVKYFDYFRALTLSFQVPSNFVWKEHFFHVKVAYPEVHADNFLHMHETCRGAGWNLM